MCTGCLDLVLPGFFNHLRREGFPLNPWYYKTKPSLALAARLIVFYAAVMYNEDFGGRRPK